MSTGNTYKVVELVGTSPEGIDRAIENAINRAGQKLRGIDWSEVKEIRGQVEEGRVAWYQVKVGIGFRVLEPKNLHKE